MTIFLCGFMGCGKTTVGRAIAKMLRLPLIDTDEMIINNEKMSIPDIFEKKGEPYFRKVEADTVQKLCTKSAVVSCGGGAMLNANTAAAAKNAGASIVFLDLSFEECYSRIKNDKNRPIVQKNTKQQLHEIFESREESYRNNSTSALKVSSDDTPNKTAKRVIELLGIAMPKAPDKENL